jgi:dihydrofolate synthase/folylpolyglutamate synthase
MSEIFKTYLELEQELHRLIGKEKFSAPINLRLERITHLLELLGNPHRDFPAIHVGGTSGKGSTATMISHILAAADYKTGLHLSPHLQILNERHQINNQVAPTSQLARLFREMAPAIEKVAAENPFGKPSYFEAQFALAMLLFHTEKVDVAVVEVGLGGARDATNVLPAQVAVLTSVGLDHTAILGDTIEAIARDKSGIIKPGQTVICGFLPESTREIVREKCEKESARLLQLNENFLGSFDEQSETCFLETPAGKLKDVKLNLSGKFQATNAACALAAVQALPHFSISEAAIRQGLQSARLPGRLEVIQKNPTVVLDGAHNPDKMKFAADEVTRKYKSPRRITVVAFKSDKDVAATLPHVLVGTDLLIISVFKPKGLWEPLPPEQIAEIARSQQPGLPIKICPEPAAAVQQALATANPDDLVWFTGSLYFVGDVREFWYSSAQLVAQAEMGLSGALVV